MGDRSRIAVGRVVGYLPTPTDLIEDGSSDDIWQATILAVYPNGHVDLTLLRPDGRRGVRYAVPPGSTAGHYTRTLPRARPDSSRGSLAFTSSHFNVGRIGTPTLGTPDTPTPDALAVFGQISVAEHLRILAVHLHLIKAGTSGVLTVEIYRRRPGLTGPLVKLVEVTIDSTAPDYGYVSAVPAGDLAFLEVGDNLFAQVTAATLVGPGGGDGVTIDIEAAPP